jgi:steroid 5-alpha reductase family enzyme
MEVENVTSRHILGATFGPTPVRNDWKAAEIWSPVVAVFGFNLVWYFIAQVKKDNSIIDTLWGLIFILGNLVTLLVSMNWNERTILTFTLISIWGLRLAYHI